MFEKKIFHEKKGVICIGLLKQIVSIRKNFLKENKFTTGFLRGNPIQMNVNGMTLAGGP